MKAILCSQFCQPDDLVLADMPDPVAGPGRGRDYDQGGGAELLRHPDDPGQVPDQASVPVLAGAEVSGVIESIGGGVIRSERRATAWSASCGHDGARQKIALPAASIVKIPDNLDFDRAAGLIIIYGTTLHALEDRASSKPARRWRCSAPPVEPALPPVSSAS